MNAADDGIDILSSCLTGVAGCINGESLNLIFEDGLTASLETKRVVIALQNLRDDTRELVAEALMLPDDVTSQLKLMAGKVRRLNIEELLRGVLSSKFDQDLSCLSLEAEARQRIAAATIHLTLSSVLVAHTINCSREVMSQVCQI